MQTFQKEKKSNKYILLGDMLELGKQSKKLHKSIAPIINRTKIDKVFVKGNKASLIFDKISKSKKGRILNNKLQIIKLIKNELNNNDEEIETSQMKWQQMLDQRLM